MPHVATGGALRPEWAPLAMPPIASSDLESVRGAEALSRHHHLLQRVNGLHVLVLSSALVAVVGPDLHLLGSAVRVEGCVDRRWRADLIHERHGEPGRGGRAGSVQYPVEVGQGLSHLVDSGAVNGQVSGDL